MIHPTALVNPEASIDPSVEIGPWCFVGPHVKLGKGCKLMSHVVVDGWTELGESNIIFPFAVVGAVPQDLKYKGEETRLKVGDRNVIRENVTINLGTVGGGGLTAIGNDNLLMSSVHIGHDCVIKDHTIIATHSGLAGHVTVEDYANVAGMVGITQFVRLGAHCYVTGQSGVEKDIPPFCVATGQRPTTLRGANIVGLRRRGFAADVITKINEAIKLWVRPDVPKEQCLLEIESQYGEIAPIQELCSFIKESEYGVVK